MVQRSYTDMAKRKPGRPKGSKNKVVLPVLPADTPPPVAGGDSLEDARAHLQWVNARVRDAEISGATPKEVAQLCAQKTAAIRLVGILSGAMNVTESKIARSEPFQKLMVEMCDVLRAYPEALGALKAWRDKYSGVR
jgi:hypothetical protein